ncbi:MAG: P-type conjugative transfer ATPase TrbB [Planctomycetota bacterium]|jgi:type IV secretion system protein VirB11|nr:P-type conjugative transfer ATPase TrbB [Planctomycetota bacterium]
MKSGNDNLSISGAGTAASSISASSAHNAASGASLSREGERYIEIRGREGSTAIYRKRVNSLEDIAEAELQKIVGIARRLPAAAFDALFDPLTVELMLNPDGRIWQEKLGGDMRHICAMRESEAEEFIRKIAGYLKKTVTRDHPILEGVLPLDDSRFAGLIPPVVAHPAFSIRRRAVRVFTLADYVDSGVMTGVQCEAIRRAVSGRENILVIGGTGSGKTTLGNAVLHEITLAEPFGRQVIIEDTTELNSTAVNKVNLQTSISCAMTDLIKTTLRLRPDRIIVGEVRGAEAFDLIQAWNTGHPGGLATLHANDCASGLRRLKSLISQHPFAPRDIEPDIALAVNVMVNIIRSGAERRIREIARVREYDPNHRKNNGYRLDVL